MKLVKAEIDGFGQLSGRMIELDAPVAVLYGPNEAGKSTVFRFIRTMLYGFAKRSLAAERLEPVHGGKHGGRLFFADEEGIAHVISRYAAEGAGKLMLRQIELEAGDESGGGGMLLQQEFERRFTGGIGDRMFRQLFAVTLSELQEVGALSGEELGQYLYQAGWDNGKAIAAAEKRLQDEMEELFKPRGSIKRMNKKLKELEQAESDLRKREDSIGAYNALKLEADKLDEELREGELRLPELWSRQQLLAKACSVRPMWLKKEQLLLTRETVSYASRITDEAERAWAELVRRRTEQAGELERLRRQALALDMQLESLTYDEALIDTSDEAEALLQAAEGYRLLKMDQAEAKAELQAQEEAIVRLLRSIAPDWTERELRELRVSVADRDFIRGLQQQGAERSRTEERISAELEAIGRQEREAEAARDEAQAELERFAEDGGKGGFALLPRTKEALRGAWNALDAAFREWELERMRLEAAAPTIDGAAASRRGAAAAERKGSAALWAAAAGSGGAALALGAVSLSAGDSDNGAGIVAALVLGVLALSIAAAAIGRDRGRSSGHGKRNGMRGKPDLAPLQDKERRLLASLAALVQEPGQAAAALLADPDGPAAPSHEQSLAAERLRGALQAAVEARLEGLQARERLARSRAEAAERGEAAASAASSKREAALQWAGWLDERALPPHMSPAAALEAIELAEQALQRLRQSDKLAAKQAAAREQLAAFETQAAKLCAALPDAAAQSAADPALGLRLLLGEARRHSAAREQASLAARQREALRQSKSSLEDELAKLQRQQAALLAEANIQGEAEYEEAIAQRKQLAQLDLELGKLRIELTAGLSEQRIGELDELIRGNDEERLEALCAQAGQAFMEAEAKRKERLERKGRLRQSMEQLLQSNERQRLLAEKELITTQLEGDAERYAVLAVSAALIKRTKRIYEEERQPVVLRNASRMIGTLTDGKYIRVLKSPGESGIKLESAERRLVDSEMLSRGTAELVYLAMRLALAEEASHHVRLPLLLDDVFVNFDRERLRAAARLITELSQQRQIVVMTCHEHVRDALLDYCTGAALVTL